MIDYIIQSDYKSMGSAANRAPRNYDPELGKPIAINSTSLLASSIRSPLLAEQQQSIKLRPSPSRLEKQIETRKQKQNKNWIQNIYFTPESKFIIIFEMIKLILIYLYFLEIPITIAFQKHRKEEDSERVFEEINIPAITFFIVGIGIKLKTAFYKEGVLIWEQRQIIINYLIYGFVFDFFSITSIVIYEFAQILNQSHSNPLSYRFIVLFFFLKISEVIRIQKSLILSFDLNRRIKAITKLFLLLIKIFMVCNVAACGFFYLSDSLCISDPQQEFKSCWVDEVKILGKTIRQSEDWTLQYSYSLYWASTTMLSIGYGDITPLNGKQVVYTIMIQFFSCFVFAYSINQIWTVVQEKNNKKKKIHQRINIMNVYMRDKNIGVGLKSRINAYLSHFYHTKNLREKEIENEIIGELTPSLKKQLFYESYGFIFKNHLFFNHFSPQFLEDVSAQIDQVGYFEEEYLSDPQQKVQTYPLYYVQKGELQKQIILGNSLVHNINLQVIENGTMIGLKEFVTQNNYKASIIALRYSLIYKIYYNQWSKYLKIWQEDFQIYHVHKNKILFENNYAKLQFKCFICDRHGHLSEQCLDRTIRSNFKNIVKKYLQTQKRAPFIRNKLRSSLSMATIKFQQKSKFRLNYEQVRPQFKKSNLSLHKKSLFHKKSHNERMTVILQRQRMKESVWTESESSEEDIIGSVLEADRVQNYEIFCPQMNSSLDLAKERRRTNMNQIFRI